MKKVFVLVEHRRGKIRDITFELLSGAAAAGPELNGRVTAVLLGAEVDPFIEQLKPWADEILAVDDSRLKHFNADAYQQVMADLIKDHQPVLTLIPQSGFGMDLAPSLAVQLNLPLTTDCFEIRIENGTLTALRQMYGGKVNAWIRFAEAPGHILTMRSSSFQAEETGKKADVIKVDSPLTEEIACRRFVDYIEAAVGDVDITQAEIVIGIGRGVKEKENMPVIEALAEAVGAVLACSRPVVDAGWLPKERQVGSSGKSIKPKLYIALGISGSFQHTAGLKGADTVVAVNKDCNAPIFGVADYGIVDDLFKIVPVLSEKIKALKG
ncbi:MAG TPA: electron transfer flavoprotein subunit alpha/FixB family protein [bacterium]|nr:electron transfer flavoprotein subunit alpha/FixB family protein [bacterium]